MRLLHVGIFNHVEGQPSLRRALNSISDLYIEYNYDSHLKNINEIIMRDVARHHVDVVFMQIQRANVIKISTLIALRNKGVKVFNFTGDVRQPLEKWYIDTAPYVTTLFTNNHDVETLQRLGYNAVYFQVGYNVEYYNKFDQPQPNAPDIVFFGNNYGTLFPLSQYRQDMVAFLKNRYGNKFKVYGNGWEGAENLNANQCKEGAIYRGCKIAINLSHFDLDRYSSDRLFRILGSGAFCLSHNYKNIELEFKHKKDLCVWNNFDELAELIDYYLEHEEQRRIIALTGNKNCEQNFTWDKRMEQFKTLIEA
jgi:glycosyltransferase involved in cell wall biosynthesis